MILFLAYSDYIEYSVREHCPHAFIMASATGAVDLLADAFS